MVDGRGTALLQKVLDDGLHAAAAEPARVARDRKRQLLDMFTDATQVEGATAQGGTFMFAFADHPGFSEWSDPVTGVLYASRPVRRAKINSVAEGDITDIGFDGDKLICWDITREIVFEGTEVCWMRQAQH